MRQNEGQTKIVSRKRGNAFGFWFFKTMARLFGLRGAYGFLYPISLHYLLFDPEAVNGALAYVQRRFPGDGFWRQRLHVYRLFVNQGKQLIDRYAAISGNVSFDVTAEGTEHLMQLLENSKEGFVLLTAHIGNWQIALTTLQRLRRTVHLVMRAEDNRAVERSLNIGKEDDFIRLISPEAEVDGILKIMNAIKQGDVVSIMGDRKYNFEAVGVTFLKDAAYLPYGAFAIAAATNCPVVVLLTAKTGYKKYTVDVRNILYPRYTQKTDKKGQLQRFVQQFARILDAYTRKHPYQCFLFHDVWKN